jgi:hypothetical protein
MKIRVVISKKSVNQRLFNYKKFKIIKVIFTTNARISEYANEKIRSSLMKIRKFNAKISESAAVSLQTIS